MRQILGFAITIFHVITPGQVYVLWLTNTHITLQRKDLLFRQLYSSPQLQLLTWFYGMVASYGQFSAHGVATGTTEYATNWEFT